MENFSHYFQKIDKLYTKLSLEMCIMPIQTSRYYFIFLMIATDVAVNDFQKISITLNPMDQNDSSNEFLFFKIKKPKSRHF